VTALTRIPRRARRVVLALGVVALLGLAARHASGSLPSIGQIRHPSPLWLGLALLAELASLVAYALVVRSLLGAWGVVARVSTLLRATVGGIAMGASLPAGQALSTAYWYKQLRREGAERGLAALALAGAMLAGVFSLAALLVLGVTVAGKLGPLAGARLPILGAAGALVALCMLIRRPVRRRARQLVRRFAPALSEDVSVGRRSSVAVAGFACLNWLLDCAALVLALAAVHASVPPESVLLTYALAQVVANLPLLPGGGGTVEVSLSLGFAAFGHTSGNVVAGVLLFRLISCWGLVPIGWLAVAAEGRRIPRLGHALPATAAARSR
jgi:uncharacterized membrane protein YbhN (UPF0104 family)